MRSRPGRTVSRAVWAGWARWLSPSVWARLRWPCRWRLLIPGGLAGRRGPVPRTHRTPAPRREPVRRRGGPAAPRARRRPRGRVTPAAMGRLFPHPIFRRDVRVRLPVPGRSRWATRTRSRRPRIRRRRRLRCLRRSARQTWQRLPPFRSSKMLRRQAVPARHASRSPPRPRLLHGPRPACRRRLLWCRRRLPRRRRRFRR